MVTLALLALVGIVGTMLLVLLASRVWGFERAFIRVSWIPMAALLVQAIFWKMLLDRLYYGAVALPVATAVVSAVPGIIGTTLTFSGASDQQNRTWLASATIVASVPILLLTIYVIWAFVSGR